MSILGYSSAYFLPQYWANTPLYGEKIIPLLDYILSTDYQYTDKLASAFYDIESKYKNTADLPIDKIEAIIEESGYGYVRDLLGRDEESLRLLVFLLVLINELKGSKRGIETVLNLLKTRGDELELHIVGNPSVTPAREVTNFSDTSYISYSNFTVGNNPFELTFNIRTDDTLDTDQCIASSPEYGFYLGINSDAQIVLRLGQAGSSGRSWQTFNGRNTNISNKPLQPSTEYFIKFAFNGSAYDISVSENDTVYSNFLSLESSTGLGINKGTLLVGIDGSTSTLRNPFLGVIKLGPLSVSANNIKITQWYETFPVDIEDTYSIEADVDVNLMSSNFFVQFAKFAERYVYPSLKAFKAKMALSSKITFLPWVRQKVTYVASNLGNPDYNTFQVLKENSSDEREFYNVISNSPKLFAWTYNNEAVYTKLEEIEASTKLYNKDMTLYTGEDFRIKEVEGSYKVVWRDIEATRDTSKDIYSTPFLTKKEDDSN